MADLAGAEQTPRVYGHVLAEIEDAPQLDAEQAIREPRAADVRVSFASAEGNAH